MGNLWNNNYTECETNGDRNKNLLLKEYQNIFKPYFRNIIVDLQESDTWKILLTIAISFIHPKDVDEEPLMHPKSDNIKLKLSNNANEVIGEPSKSLLSKYQNNLETSMRPIGFIFDSVQLMYY